MKIVVTGAGGMLGQELAPCLSARDHKVTALPKEDLDVTNYNRVQTTLSKLAPELIVHCAAYTKVDQANPNRDCLT